MQESGIIEVISYIFILAIWGQHPVFLISQIPPPHLPAWITGVVSLLGALIHIWRLQTADGCYPRLLI